MLPVDLWHGTVTDFLRAATSGALASEMTGKFVSLHGYLPNPAELTSWRASLPSMAEALRPLRDRDLGVSVGASGLTGPASGAGSLREETHGEAAVAAEYHLPLSGKRVDVLVTGQDAKDRPWAVVVELKQWSSVGLEDEHSTNVTVMGEEHNHPSEQALDYARWLGEYHSAFLDGATGSAPAAFCHNLEPTAASSLRDSRFADVLRQSPLFVKGEEKGLVELLGTRVGHGAGRRVLERILGASFQPSRRVLESLQSVLDGDREWHLLDEQRVAFNAIRDEVERRRAGRGRSVVIVRGAPGTGKTVIAVQLLAAALQRKWKAAHSTGGKAFTTALRSKFSGADGLFLWNLHLRDAPTQGLDLLLVDEAHRVRETSDTRWTRGADRGKKSQARELIDAARVTVFLLDDDQYVRPDEVGSTRRLESEALGHGARVKRFDLQAQFRCGGCLEYVQWVDWLLGFNAERPKPWEARYRAALAERPEDIESWIRESRGEGGTARMVAGFCWEWSDPPKSGPLVDDVVIGSWRRPWNRKAKGKAYKPAQHPYTLWAETSEGKGQVGCIYSAQGFEFDRVGVIWGEDLVWRKDHWVAQKAHSEDRPVKGSKDMLTLVRNAYRVLLTRGMSETRILVLDPETREHIAEALRKPA